jgi:hypothetical protein
VGKYLAFFAGFPSAEEKLLLLSAARLFHSLSPPRRMLIFAGCSLMLAGEHVGERRFSKEWKYFFRSKCIYALMGPDLMFPVTIHRTTKYASYGIETR